MRTGSPPPATSAERPWPRPAARRSPSPSTLVGVGEAAPAAETIPLPAATAPTERQRARGRGRRRLRRVVIPLIALLVAAALTFGALIVVPRLTIRTTPHPSRTASRSLRSSVSRWMPPSGGSTTWD